MTIKNHQIFLCQLITYTKSLRTTGGKKIAYYFEICNGQYKSARDIEAADSQLYTAPRPGNQARHFLHILVLLHGTSLWKPKHLELLPEEPRTQFSTQEIGKEGSLSS